ncbi:hypothetical protein D3C84_1154820 [compost metagenome]
MIQERPLQSMTRIVDEHIDHYIAFAESLMQFDDRRDRGQVYLFDDHIDAKTFAQLRR